MVHTILKLFALGLLALTLGGCQTCNTGPAGIPLPEYAEEKSDPVVPPQNSVVPAAEYAN
jgi:hypothetical protein